MKKYKIVCFISLFFAGVSTTSNIFGQSQLLENVKENPEEAIALCRRFRALNSKGISSGSKEVIEQISREKQLSSGDAEILSIYIVGMYCPEIK